MQLRGRLSEQRPLFPALVLASCFTASVSWFGCASPGAPRPPSLQLPRSPGDLTASRSGANVVIRFTVPDRTTEGLPLRGNLIAGSLCRQASVQSACQPVALPAAVTSLPVHPGKQTQETALWTDHLPAELAAGPAHLIFYRLQLSNSAGRSAGYSNPVAVAAGAAPPPVSEFHAEGTRPGVFLQWMPQHGAGEVLLERQQLEPAPAVANPKPARPKAIPDRFHPRTSSAGHEVNGTVWLQAEPGNPGAEHALDGSVTDGYRYRYSAVRRVRVELGGTMYELRSAPSAAAEITWRDIYPPPTPEKLAAVGFETPAKPGSGAAPTFAVDLIWEPVRDPRVTGYLVRRLAISPAGAEPGTAEDLSPEPLTSPSFHDTTAQANEAYRYEVRAVDGKGNVSAPAMTNLDPIRP